MDINDILGMGGHTKRPSHPDFHRVLEISMAMRADMTEHEGDFAKQKELWEKRVAEVIDPASLNYHAMQAAIHIHNIQTGADYQRMLANPEQHRNFIGIVQAFYDGFLFGAQFEKRGGHQSPEEGQA